MKALDFLDSDEQVPAGPAPGMKAEDFLDAEPPGMIDQALSAVKGFFSGPAEPAFDEKAFQGWYADVAGRTGLNPNPDDPQHFYDYRAAYKSGAMPDAAGHWPSQFKLPEHPNRFVDGIDTITGQPAAPTIQATPSLPPQPAPVATPGPVLPGLEPGTMEGFQTPLARMGMLGPQSPQQTYRDVGGAGEAIASIASSVPALAAAGAGGLMEMASAEETPVIPRVAETAKKALETFTYQPKSPEGQNALEFLATPVEKYSGAMTDFARKVYDEGLDLTDPETGNQANQFKGNAFAAAFLSVAPELAAAAIPFLRGRSRPSTAMQQTADFMKTPEGEAGLSAGQTLRDIARKHGTGSPEWEAALKKYAYGSEAPPAAEAPPARPPAPEPPPAPETPGTQLARSQFEQRFMQPAAAEPPQPAQAPAPVVAPPPAPSAEVPPAIALPAPKTALPAQTAPSQPESAVPAEAAPAALPATVSAEAPWKSRGQEKSSNPLTPEDADYLLNQAMAGKKREGEAQPQTVILTGGPPGAGKSTGTKFLGIDRKGFVIADADAIKEAGGWGEGKDAQAFHEESSRINKSLRERSIDQGLDTIYDSLLSNFTEADKVVQQAQGKMAKVIITASDISAETSQSRAMQRQMMYDPKTGKALSDREIPLDASVKGYNFSLPTFKALYSKYFMDPNVDFVLMNNDVDGRPPVIVFSQKDGITQVHDEKLFDEFQKLRYRKVEKGGEIKYERVESLRNADLEARFGELRDRAYRSAVAQAAKEGLAVRQPGPEIPQPDRPVHRERTEGNPAQPVRRPEQLAPPAPPEPTATPAPQTPTAKPAKFGQSQKLVIPGKSSVPVRFALMETADVVPSHSPTSFSKNQAYPEGVQERQYHADKGEQAKVVQNAQKLKTNLLLTNNPDAVNGPPIVTPGGIVLGGNSRAMVVARAYAQDGQFGKGSKYKDKLAQFAAQFGLNPDDVRSMREPQLVRVIETPDADPKTLHRLASDFNRPLTQAMSSEAKTASMGRNVSPEVIESLGAQLANSEKTLREFLGSKGLEVLDKLIADGVVPAGDRSQYVSAKYQKLNPSGVDLVERVIFGSIIDDADLISTAPASFQNKIVRALPDIAKVKARGDQWDITPQLKQALEAVTDAKNLDFKTLPQYYAQQGLFGDGKNRDPIVRALAEHLWDTAPVKFGQLWKDYAREASYDVKNQTQMFGGKGQPEAFREVFGGKDVPPQAPPAQPGQVLYSGIPIPEIARVMRKLGDLYTRRIGSPVWDRFVMETLPRLLEHVPGGKAVNRALIYDYRGDLPDAAGYMKSFDDMHRAQAIGREYAIDLGKRLQALPEESQIRMGEAIRGELPLEQLPPQEGRLAIEAVRAMTELGRQAVDAGLLNEETYFKHVGRYMPRLYTSKEYKGLLSKYGLTKPNRLDLSRFKKRKDIPEEIRQEMGEILSPGYPIAKGIIQMTHDIELAKFFNGIADNEEWAWTKNLPKEYYDEVRKDLLDAKKANAKDEIPLEDIVAMVQKVHPDALIDIREDAIGRQRVVIENGAPIPEGFLQMPKSAKLGRLSEAYVHPEIFNDLQDAIRVMGEGEKAIKKALAAWKFGKVVASPKTHIRNLMSNSILAHLGGMPMYEQPVYLWKAASELKNQGDYWKQAKEEGLLLDTFTQAELRSIFDSLPDLGGVDSAQDMPAVIGKMQRALDAGRKVTSNMAKLYELEEQWFKLAKFIHSQERLGLSPTEAFKDAEKWLFNYSKVTRFQREYRQSLFGAPFATFTFKALPRIAEAAIKTPWRFLLPGAMVFAIEEAARQMIGDSKEEREAKKKLRPEYMQTTDFMGIPNFVRFPFLDEYGREHWLNLTYILPWGDIAEGGDFMGIPGALRPMSHPLTNELAQQIMNYDAFRKDNIVKDKDIEGLGGWDKVLEQAKARGAHLFNTFAPTPVTDVAKGIESMRREPQGRFGRVRDKGVVAADAIAGVKLYPIDYAEEMLKRVNKLDPAKGDIARRLVADIKMLAQKKKITEDRGGDGARYQREIDKKVQQIGGLGKELKEYGEAFGKLNRAGAK